MSNRLPTEVKKARGTLNVTREKEGPPVVPAAEIGDPPAWMDAGQKDAWARLSIAVASLGCVGAGDMEAFTALVMAAARVQKVLRSKASGQVQTNAALKELRLWLGEFGLTPASRGRVRGQPKTGVPDEEDPFAEFMTPSTFGIQPGGEA